MDKTQTWYGYVLADGLLRCARLLAGESPRADAVRVYGPIESRSRLLAYRDVKVLYLADAPIADVAEEDARPLRLGIESVVSQYALLVGREDASEVLAGLLVRLSEGRGYEVDGGRVTVELGESHVDMPAVVNIEPSPAMDSSICSTVAGGR